MSDASKMGKEVYGAWIERCVVTEGMKPTSEVSRPLLFQMIGEAIEAAVNAEAAKHADCCVDREEAARKIVDDMWRSASKEGWVVRISQAITAHTEAALVADRLARHDETVAAIEAAVKVERERIRQKAASVGIDVQSWPFWTVLEDS